MQARGKRSGRNLFFDIFRIADGLVVEHWAFSTQDAPPNQSGHTQTDGPTEPKHLEETEKNKSFVRRYYETFHIAGDHSQSDQYFTGDLMIRHEPGVRDGVSQFMGDVKILMQHRTIDAIKLLVGQGDLVFLAAKGTHQGDACVYIDSTAWRTRRSWSIGAFPRWRPLLPSGRITTACCNPDGGGRVSC